MKTQTSSKNVVQHERTDSYQRMKRAMESFNIEESMVSVVFYHRIGNVTRCAVKNVLIISRSFDALQRARATVRERRTELYWWFLRFASSFTSSWFLATNARLE